MDTYYIDYAGGDDSNNGTAKGTPWKRHPYMTGWTGSYSHSAGDVFIFKGGVTWPKECFPMAIAAGGSGGAGYDKYTTDATWYTGGAWARPCFDNEYYETSAATVRLNASYIEISNIELKRHKSSVPAGGSGLMYANGRDYILLSNLYVHGWLTTAATDDAHGGLLFYKAAGLTASVILENSTIENSENTVAGTQSGVAIRQIKTIRNCTIHDVSSAVLFTADIHDCTIYNVEYPAANESFDPTYHNNCIYLDQGGSTTYYCYNNKIYDVPVGSGAIYPVPEVGSTHYIYNNLVYGTIGSQYAVQVDPDHDVSGVGVGSVFVYNNTFVIEQNNFPAVRVVSRTGKKIDSLTCVNNHIIGTGASVTNATGTLVNSVTAETNLIQTLAEASAEGCVEADGFLPHSTSSTVDAGDDLSPTFTTDLLGTTRPDGAAWDIGAYEYVHIDAPSSLTATASGSSSISLTWTDNATDETGYVVERSLNGTTGWTVIATLAADSESYTDSGLLGGTAYHYRVKAVNAYGSSAYSDTATDTTDAAPVLSAGVSVGAGAAMAFWC